MDKLSKCYIWHIITLAKMKYKLRRLKGLIILNGVGVVDSDYYNNSDNEGEIGFVFYNMLDEDVILEAGEKLGQGIFVKFLTTDNDVATETRIGGFGSTGK